MLRQSKQDMKQLSVGEVKAKFSDILKDVQNGEEIAVTFGKKKEIVAFLVPKNKKGGKRPLGLFTGKGAVIFEEDFKISEEEFLGL